VKKKSKKRTATRGGYRRKRDAYSANTRIKKTKKKKKKKREKKRSRGIR